MQLATNQNICKTNINENETWFYHGTTVIFVVWQSAHCLKAMTFRFILFVICGFKNEGYKFNKCMFNVDFDDVIAFDKRKPYVP